MIKIIFLLLVLFPITVSASESKIDACKHSDWLYQSELSINWPWSDIGFNYNYIKSNNKLYYFVYAVWSKAEYINFNNLYKYNQSVSSVPEYKESNLFSYDCNTKKTKQMNYSRKNSAFFPILTQKSGNYLQISYLIDGIGSSCDIWAMDDIFSLVSNRMLPSIVEFSWYPKSPIDPENTDCEKYIKQGAFQYASPWVFSFKFWSNTEIIWTYLVDFVRKRVYKWSQQ